MFGKNFPKIFSYKTNKFLTRRDTRLLKTYLKKYKKLKIDLNKYKNQKKKLTGYILFSKEQYAHQDSKKKINSTMVADMWNNMKSDEKALFGLMAKAIYGKKPTRAKKKKIVTYIKHKPKKTHFKYLDVKVTNKLEIRKINGKEYIVDAFDNIVTLSGEDIGHINGNGKVVLYADIKKRKEREEQENNDSSDDDDDDDIN